MRELNEQKKTVAKIIDSATALFNEKGYAGSSISDISKRAQLSKGILYHYFKNKNDLYLFCAKKCIKVYRAYLEERLQSPAENADWLMENVKLRIRFFEEHPQYRTLFQFITSKKPDHLAQELTEIREELDEDNDRRMQERTAHIRLGKGVQREDISSFITILRNNATILSYEPMDEAKKELQIRSLVRLTKIFINGLERDVE